MRFLLVLILPVFFIAELYLLIRLGQHYGAWLLLYLVVVGLLGLRLIRDEKEMISSRMMQSLGAGGNPVKALLGSARNMIAGVLLLIPGVISDIIAVMLLLIPIQQQNPSPHASGAYKGARRQSSAANDDVIEGEYVHVVEETQHITEKE